MTASLIGWAYVLCWAASYYPQAFLNYKNASTKGLSLDFVLLNVTGYFCYAVYNSILYFSQSVRTVYLAFTGLSHISIEIFDVIFAVHGCIITVVIAWQYFHYTQRSSWFVGWSRHGRLACICLWVISFFVTLLLLYHSSLPIVWIVFLRVYGHVKIAVTLLKYPPQLYLNYTRSSTSGWSVGYSWLDISGGSLCILSMCLTWLNTGDPTYVTANIPKTGLALLAVVCNSLLLVQHYLLYPETRRLPEKYTP